MQASGMQLFGKKLGSAVKLKYQAKPNYAT